MASPLLLTNAMKGGTIMAQGEWKTINGAHVFIEDGQSVEDAFDKRGTSAKSGFGDSVKNSVKQGFDGTLHPGKSEKARFKIGLDFFSEKGLYKETNQELRDGIQSILDNRELHIKKLQSPEKYCENWDTKTEIQKWGTLNFWRKEVRGNTNAIIDRIEHLKRRGENVDEYDSLDMCEEIIRDIRDSYRNKSIK